MGEPNDVEDQTSPLQATPGEELDRFVTIWARVVETQMHFNEMQVKSRQLGLTFVTAALGVAFVLLSSGDDFTIVVPLWRSFPLLGDTLDFHISALLVFGSIFALKAVRKLDLGVYHPMLRGAVTFGMDFEEKYMKKIFNLEQGMTQAISHFSRYEDASVTKCSKLNSYHYAGNQKVTAQGKIGSFYSYTTKFLWGAACTLFLVTNISLLPGDGPAVSDNAETLDTSQEKKD